MKIAESRITICLLALTLVEGLTHFGQVYPDSSQYIATALYFQGTGNISGFAFKTLLRPIIPLLASALGYLVGISTSFGIINLVFWCGACLLMFEFTKFITRDMRVAFIATVMFTTSVPILFYGASVLTDMGGYFFILLATYLIFKWDIPKASISRIVTAAAIVGLGVLTRETVASVLLIALAWALLSKGSLPKTILFGAASMAIAILWTTASGTSYWNWFMSQTQFQTTYQHLTLEGRILTWFQTIYLAFRPEGVILAVIGFIAAKRIGILRTLATMLIGLAGFLILTPGVVDYRYTFILFPAVLPLAGLGVVEITNYIITQKSISKVISKRSWAARLIPVLIILILVGYYVLETNRIALRFISLPWKPYITPD
ncbi:MAG: hypothetical protein ABSF09_08495 [Candidatus Bathyarchaeia archaeon]